MLEIFLLLVGLFIPAGMMARKGGRGRMARYLKGNVDESFNLSTLASATLISNTWDEVVVERTRCSSIVVSWSLDQITSPQGPILFGVAHSDYSDAEIEEVIENAGSSNEGDLVSQEIAKRKIRIIGEFVSTELAGLTDVKFNLGRPVKTKLNWVLTTGDTLKMWAYNISASALATTDPAMRAHGHANLWTL